MHWGWYWRIKRKHKPKPICEAYKSLELDSFSMFRNYSQQVQLIRESAEKCSLYIPRYDLKAYLQDDDSLLVKYNAGTYIIPVEKKSCFYGGYYYFFHCPRCSKRIRKLYCLDGQYLCRKCGNLGYYSQRLKPTDRFLLQESDKISKRIKDLGGNINSDLKPPRMHKKTFQAYKDRGEYLEAKYKLAVILEARDCTTETMKYFDNYLAYEALQIIKRYKRNRRYAKKSGLLL